jgi:hypothetical protein
MREWVCTGTALATPLHKLRAEEPMPGGTPQKEKWAMAQRWFLATLLVTGFLGLAYEETEATIRQLLAEEG